MADGSVANTFEGSRVQSRILKLREIEDRLGKLKALAQLLEKASEGDEDTSINITAWMMAEMATEALATLSIVERQ
jgi:hypothetical protein